MTTTRKSSIPATVKQPQDRKPKTGGGYEFEAGGKTYEMPPLGEDIMSRVPGGIVMDASVDPDDMQAQTRLAFAMVKAIEGHDETVAALRSLPFPEMARVAAEWATSTAGGSLGE